MASVEEDDERRLEILVDVRIERRRRAIEICKDDPSIDPGDVEHVLFCMTLLPIKRLNWSLNRAAQLSSLL